MLHDLEKIVTIGKFEAEKEMIVFTGKTWGWRVPLN